MKILYRGGRLPKEKRTIPLPATDTHKGKWFKCWNCGFPCFTDREKLGEGLRGYEIREYVDQDHAPLTGFMNDRALNVDIFGQDIRLMQLDSFGNPVPTVGNFTQKVVMGCPLCGCTRYK